MILNKINSLIVFFFAVVFFLAVGVWEFLQSDFVGRYLNKQVNSYLPKEAKEKVAFEKVSIRFFPPGVSLERITVKDLDVSNTKLNITAFLDELRLNFNIFNALRNQLTLKDLILVGGDVVVEGQIGETQESSGEDNNTEFIKQVVQEIIPRYLRNLIFEDVNLSTPWIDGFLTRSEFNFYNKVSYLDFQGTSIQCFLAECKESLPEDGFLDGVDLRAELLPGELRVKRFDFTYLLSQLWGNGILRGDIYNFKELKFEGILNSSIFIKNLHSFDKALTEYNGHVLTKSNFEYKNNQISSVTEGEVKNIVSPYAKIKNGKFTAKNIGQKLFIENALIDDPDGKIETLNSFELLDIKKLSLLEPKFKVKLTKAHSNKLLYFLKDSLDPLKTPLTGILDLDVNINRVKIKGKNVKSEYIALKDGAIDIFNFKNIIFKDMNFDIDVNTEIVDVLGELEFGESKANIKGQIRGKDLNAKVDMSSVNLKDVSPIAGQEFIGKGRATLDIAGPYDDVKFDLDINAEDSEYLDLKLGEVRGRIELFLGKKLINFLELKNKLGPSTFTLNGNVSFENDTTLDLDIYSDSFVYDDAVKMLYPITSGIKYLPRGIVGRFSSKTKITGKTKNLEFSAKTKVLARDMFYETESFSRASFELDFIKRKVFLKNAKLYKDRGVISPVMSYDLDTETLEYKIRFSNLPLTEFQLLNRGNLGISGLLSLGLDGKAISGKNKFKLSTNLFNSRVAGKNVPNSNLEIDYDQEKIKSSFQLLGNDITGEFDLDISDRPKTSNFSLRSNSKNLKELISIFRPHNIRRDDLFGRLVGQLDFSGKFNELEKSNLKLNIQDFNFFSKDFSLKLDPRFATFQIRNGKIGNDKIQIVDGVNKINVSGQGDLRNQFNAGASVNLKGEAFEFIFDRIIKSSGKFFFSFDLQSKEGIKNLDNKIVLKGENFSTTVKDIPASFTNVNFVSEFEKNVLDLKSAKGLFGGGEFEAFGFVRFKFPFPEIGLEIKSTNSRVDFFKNTNVWISTSTRLEGVEPPYLLTGDVSIVNATVNDEPEDFNASRRKEFNNPYLPQVNNDSGLKLVELNLNVKSLRPIKIKNSLAAMNFHTNLVLSDSLFSPRIRGDLRLVPGTGKFFFKNNDFVLTRGSVALDGISTLEPNLDFEGVTTINDYQIFLTVNGTPNNYNLTLNSNPSLSEDDIVGLLATGLTSDKTSRLSEGEKESITSLGIGAIIFDRFKINQELQSALGINLSIAPDIDEDNNSGVNEINRSRSRGQSRSTTKVSVKKNLTNKAYLSVSSTVGGETGDRQKLNMNYDFSDNLSVEGVYEVRSREEADTNDDNDSVGMDLKWRLEF